MYKLHVLLYVLFYALTFSGCCEDDDATPIDVYAGCCGSTPNSFSMDDINLYLPSAFTPNNDGVNDRFLILGNSASTAPKTIKSFTIRSRTGEILYQNFDTPTNEYDYGWNGKMSDDNEPYTGLFDFEITLEDNEGNEVSFTGSACVLNCEDDLTNQIDNIADCAFGLNHDGQGGYDPDSNSGETCF